RHRPARGSVDPAQRQPLRVPAGPGAVQLRDAAFFGWKLIAPDTPHPGNGPMLTIYGRKSSFNVQKVMWLVGELGVAHRHVELGGSYGGLDTPEFRAMNPHGRVPVVDDEGTIVWESHAILRYLAASYGRGRFWSDDAAQRSLSDR